MDKERDRQKQTDSASRRGSASSQDTRGAVPDGHDSMFDSTGDVSHQHHHHSSSQGHHSSSHSSPHSSHDPHRRRKKTSTKLAILAVLVIALAAAILAGVHHWEENTYVVELAETAADDETGGTTYFNGTWYNLNDNLETILIMGVDKYEESISDEEDYRNDQQADFLILLIFDHETETFSALHLNRDTMTQITILGVTGEAAGSFTGQLALAHTYGDGTEESCENTVDAVTNLLYGMEIDHYLSMTMDAVSILNDLVGGVTVTVLADFTSVDASLVEGETVTLTGEQALIYVRTRKDLEDSTNLSRMERQRQYMGAFLTQLQAALASDTEFSASALLEVNEYLVSDCTINQLSDLADSVGLYTFTEVYTIDGEAVEGEEYMEYYVDEEALQELIIDLFYVEAD